MDAFAGSPNARFRIVATDGIHIGFADSAAVSIPNKEPFEPIITDPANGHITESGALVVMQGSALDLEDGRLPDGQLSWDSNQEGVLGVGPSIPTNTLQNGEHVITLTATDSQGAKSSTSVTIFVGDRLYLPSVNK